MTRAVVDFIKALEREPSINAKEDLIRAHWNQGHREFFAAARIALNPINSYGQKKVALIDEADDGDGELNFAQFMVLAEKLRKRELTGNAAKAAINDAANVSGVDVWNYFYRRILLKDFKIGCSHSTINRVLDSLPDGDAREYRVPVFSCQLAESGDKHPKKLTGRKYLDVKLNGVRLLVVVDVDARTVTLRTRNGLINNNFPHITEEFERLIPHLPHSMVFDGEVVGKTFQELMSQISRKDADTSQHKLAIFDLIPLADFQNGKCAIPQHKRHQALVDLVPTFQDLRMMSATVLPKVEVDLSTQEGKDRMRAFRKEVMEAAAANGDENVIEGFMIKGVDSPYVSKKGTYWLKWKPDLTVDLTVVGVEIGDPDGKYGKTLGALVCEGWDEGRFIRTNVSSGIEDHLRDEWWADPSKIVGYIVEIKADEMTQNEDAKNTENYSLRFPRFISVRGLFVGDKI